MTSKTTKALSNGTLGLRFMQNAQRAKQQQETHLHRAEIHDDSKWEVSKIIQEAWGDNPSCRTSTTPSSSTSQVTYETSYLPFLFPGGSDTSDSDPSSESGQMEDEQAQPQRRKGMSGSKKLLGRREFGKKGKEVVLVSNDDLEDEPLPAAAESFDRADRADSPPAKGKKSKVHPNPRPISSARNDRVLSGLQEPEPGHNDPSSRSPDKKRMKTSAKLGLSAREAIFLDPNSGSGSGSGFASAPAPASTIVTDAAPGSTVPRPKPVGFMKPSGVDDPNELKRKLDYDYGSGGEEIINGARAKPKSRKR